MIRCALNIFPPISYKNSFLVDRNFAILEKLTILKTTCDSVFIFNNEEYQVTTYFCITKNIGFREFIVNI